MNATESNPKTPDEIAPNAADDPLIAKLSMLLDMVADACNPNNRASPPTDTDDIPDDVPRFVTEESWEN